MNVLDRIAKTLGPPEPPSNLIEGWTTIPKAQTFAAIILGLHPDISVEVGVWHGRGSIAMAMAHKEIGHGIVYSIDAWDATASVEGQVHPADKAHWSRQNVHDDAFQKFNEHIIRCELHGQTKVVRARSLAFMPPEGIGFLVLDGNHGETTIFDVGHYCPKVRTGGILYMDDLDWTGGAVRRAYEKAKTMGFVDLYKFEQGVFLQRA